MTVGIYAIFSNIDDSCLYVGQSKDAEERVKQHVRKLQRKSSFALESFVEWYHLNGATSDLLRCELLEECADDDLVRNAKEAYRFDELRPVFYGKVPSLSERWSQSDTTRMKIRASNIAKSDAILLEEGRGRDEEGRPLLRLFCSGAQCANEFWWHKRKKYCSKECLTQERNFSHVTKEQLQSYLSKGMDMYQIAEILGCSSMTVSKMLRDANLRVGVDRKQYDNAVNNVSKATLYELYVMENKTVEEVGKKLNLGDRIVSKLLDHYKIPRRTTSEAAKIFWTRG